jgi:hypothetical protein
VSHTYTTNNNRYFPQARPNYVVAFNNHGLALSTMAKWTANAELSDALFQRAYNIFARISTPLVPSTYHCQSNYAMTLTAHARLHFVRQRDDEARRLVSQLLQQKKLFHNNQLTVFLQ